ncbi:MAG: hypothetical protein ACTSRZ_19020 [Promethearchaeota archaeon]
MENIKEKIKYDKKSLMNLFCNCAKDYVEEIDINEMEEVLNQALYHFEKETSQPIESFKNAPREIKVQIFQILLKHFIIGLKNKHLFDDTIFKSIEKDLESIADKF